MSKLKNINTIQKIIDGTSRWQTRTTVGFSDINSVQERNKERADGEVWEEKVGTMSYWWRIKDGIKTRYNVHPNLADQLADVRASLKSFWNCPKDSCTCINPKPIDEKFRIKVGMCEDCTITHETRLKLNGKFNEYARDKMKQNALAFFKQADEDVKAIKAELMSSISFVAEDGSVEKWSTDNQEALLNRIDADYLKFKNDIMIQIYGVENGIQAKAE